MMLGFALFLARLQPELVAIAQDLYRLYRGDPTRAKQALRRVPDWGAVLDAAESELDARMRVLRERKS